MVVSPDEMNRHVSTVDKVRLVARLGTLDHEATAKVLRVLAEFFAE